MRKIKAAAIKTPRGVKSKPAPSHHADIHAKGVRGFLDTSGKFLDRQEAKTVAKNAGQATVRGKRGLHSRDIFKRGGS